MPLQGTEALPAWGPYSKRYVGTSHVADAARGIRFDLSVFPGLYRRRVDVPNVAWESGYHPWEASPDLRYYSFRHEVVWKDAVYADIAYIALDDHATLVRCAMVNNTDVTENLVLHYMASLAYPTQPTHSHLYVPSVDYRVSHPEGVRYRHALAYAAMAYQTPRPTDHLMPDGLKRGELRHTGLVEGAGLGMPLRHERVKGGFGEEAGDRVRYDFELDTALPGACLQLRYAQWMDGAAFALSGSAAGELVFAPGEGMQTLRVALGDLPAGQHTFTLTSRGKGPVLIDSLLLGTEARLDACRYEPQDTGHTPEITLREDERMMALRYSACQASYGIYWDFEPFWVREIRNSELDTFMRANVHHHTNHIMEGDGKGHFTNVFQRPIRLEPHSARTLYGVVLDAPSVADAFAALKTYAAQRGRFEAIHEAARRACPRYSTETGQPYAFSQARMAATTLTNVVYPVYRKGAFILHNTPGRWWDCLYTWDSGFVGIGLNTLDSRRAMACLDTYLTEPGDEHCAFIHHGSMVPTQFYLMHEIWNETRCVEWLAYAYPRLKQYYEFFVGRLGSSTTARLSSGLLKTWDYFYNSGGWDDYPPQVHVHRNGLTASVAPASTTAHAVRCARLLKAFAAALGGHEHDMAQYERDAARLMDALNEHAYDPDTGYYGYVQHDAEGRASGILRHEGGQNYNMGLDGLQPMLTGLLTDAQLDRMVALLMEPGRIWSDIGLSTVDQSARYYTIDGYWNGAVWMPHQWFFYKALLDAGRVEEAWRIAKCALDVWKHEVDTSYHCFEHFIVDSKRGAGWHQFSGLSCPVLYWYKAYCTPGSLTFGLDVWIRERTVSEDCRHLRATLSLQGPAHRMTGVVAVLAEGGAYRARFAGQEIPVRRRLGGAVELLLPNQAREGVLEISCAE